MIKPTTTTIPRVFIVPANSSPNTAPRYQGCLVPGGITQSTGEGEPIRCLDPFKVGAYITIGRTVAPPDSVESSLNGRFAQSTRSLLAQIARDGTKVDIHVHLAGPGTNPSLFHKWDTKIIFEGAKFTQYSVDDLGAHDEDTVVNETVDFTADNWYQLGHMEYTRRGSVQTARPMVAAVIEDSGNINLAHDERYIIASVGKTDGSSPYSGPELVYSPNGGKDWYAFSVSVADTQSNATDAIAYGGDFVMLTDGATDGVIFAPFDGMDGINVPLWGKVTAGIDANYEPTKLASAGGLAFFAGKKAAIYRTSNITSGLEKCNGAVFTGTDALLDISAYDDDHVVAVGANNLVLLSIDGYTFNKITGPAVGVALTSVATPAEDVILVGTANGKLFYSVNNGRTWVEKVLAGGGSGTVTDIKFASQTVGYASHNLTGSSAVLYMTTDAGFSWERVPSAGLSTMADQIAGLGVARGDVNNVILAGELSSAGSLVMGVAPI